MGCCQRITTGTRYVRWRSYWVDPCTVKMHTQCATLLDILTPDFDFSNEDGSPYELEELAEAVGRRFCVECYGLDCDCAEGEDEEDV